MADPYSFGTRSGAIRALQQALAARGFDPGPADGIFGRSTRAAVQQARLSFGLGEGGVDELLLDRLGRSASPLIPTLLLDLIFSVLKGRLPMTFLAGYRTYIIAAIMLLTGLSGLLGIDVPSFTGHAPGSLVMEALAFFFLRQGLKSAGNI
jgi:peptidoglycan hydrolase-like protein with peptidoglycan-binding domain